MRHETLTVMLTDIKGFTKRTASATREEAAQLVHQHEKLLVPLLRRFGGNLVKSIGDALLVTFRSPTNALLAAQAVHDKLWTFNRTVDKDDRIDVRIAVSLGEVRVERSDIFGDAVNIASRIESLTPVGEIYLTQSVALSMNRQEVEVEELGRKELKGLPEPVMLYRVSPQTKGERTAPFGGRALEHAERFLSRRVVAIGVVAVGAIVLAVLVSIAMPRHPSGRPVARPPAVGVGGATDSDLGSLTNRLNADPGRDAQARSAMETLRRAPREPTELLLGMLVERSDPGWSSVNAARVLVDRGDADRVNASRLQPLLAKEPRNPLAGAARRVFEAAPRPWVERAVTPWIGDDDYNVRHAAADILRAQGFPVDAVRLHLNDLRLPAGCADKLEAARSLAGIAPAGRAALRDLADDPPAGVRSCPEVRSFLTRFGGGPAPPQKRRPGPPAKKRR